MSKKDETKKTPRRLKNVPVEQLAHVNGGGSGDSEIPGVRGTGGGGSRIIGD